MHWNQTNLKVTDAKSNVQNNFWKTNERETINKQTTKCDKIIRHKGTKENMQK